MASFYATNYDPFGSLLRGVGTAFRLADIAESRRERERRRQLAEEDASQRRRIFELNIAKAEREKEEEEALPGSLEQVLAATLGRPAETQTTDLGETTLPAGEIALPAVARARTLQDVQARLGPGGALHLARVMRRAPGVLTPLGLQHPVDVEAQDLAKKRQEQSDTLWAGALKKLQDPQTVSEGLADISHAEALAGRRPPIEQVVASARDQRDWEWFTEEAGRLGALTEKALANDEGAARALVAESFKLRSGLGRQFVPQIWGVAQQVLGTKLPADAVRGMARFYELLPAHGNDPIKTLGALGREDPKAVYSMRERKVLPLEVEEASRAEADVRAATRAGATEERRLRAREGVRREAWDKALTILEEGQRAGKGQEDVNREIRAKTGLDPEEVRTGQPARTRAEVAVRTVQHLANRVAMAVFPDDPVKQQAFAEWADRRRQGWEGKLGKPQAPNDIYAEFVNQVSRMGGDPKRFPSLQEAIKEMLQRESMSRKDPRYQGLRAHKLTDEQIEKQFNLKLTD